MGTGSSKLINNMGKSSLKELRLLQKEYKRQCDIQEAIDPESKITLDLTALVVKLNTLIESKLR